MTREEKMNKRRDAGKGYKYKPNPFAKGTREYYDEKHKRASKNVSHKVPLAREKSMMAKLDNQIAKEKSEKIKHRNEKGETGKN